MLYISIALAMDEPLSAQTAILGLLVSAIISAFALWLGLSPFREKYADDPEGKRSPTLKRDAELVSSLWWDAVFLFVLWIVLGFGVTFLLTQGMDLLTLHQGWLLLLFFLLTIPLIAVSESGGTAHRHLKAAWVESLAQITRIVLRYGFGIFSLLVIYGTLNWFEGTWVELLRTKGGALFELGYVAALSTAVWFGFLTTWRAVKKASAAHDERQEAARKAKRKAKAKSKKTTPRPETAVPAQSISLPSESPTPASAEFELLRLSVAELEKAHEKTLVRLRKSLAAMEEPDSWSCLTANWIDSMVAFLQDRNSAPPQWLHAAKDPLRHENKQADPEEQTEYSATRLMGAWIGLRLSGISKDSNATDEPSATLEAHRAMTGFIADVMRGIGGVPNDALRSYAQHLAQTSESGQSDREYGFGQDTDLPENKAVQSADSGNAAYETLERAVGFDLGKLEKARAKWLEKDEYTPRAETREFAKLVFENPDDERCIELIKAGVNPNVKAGYVQTALTLASETGSFYLVKAMLEYGAFPDQRGSYQETALCNALSENHSEIAMILIEAGANVNTTGNSGFTPLIMAASKGNDAIVRVLMKRGADSEYRVSAQFGGMNAEEIAAHNGQQSTAKLIVELKSEYRPEVNIRHGKGYPVLSDAYYEECFAVQCALVKVRD